MRNKIFARTSLYKKNKQTPSFANAFIENPVTINFLYVDITFNISKTKIFGPPHAI